MSPFRKIIQFGIPFKGYALLNILFNAFYALFSALSFVSLIPMLNVLFKTTEKQSTPVTYSGILSLQKYLKDSLNYYVSSKLEQDIEGTLIFVISLVLGLFLLKNISNYLALFFIAYLRNGILKNLRNALYLSLIHI